MAIRDGISIERDEERAREEKQARRARRARKRGGEALRDAADEQAARRKPSAVLAVLAIVFIFVVASAYAFFALRQTPLGPSIEIGLDKTEFRYCETLNVTVWLSNPSKGAYLDYTVKATQNFGLEIKNESGGVVAASVPEPADAKTTITLEPGQKTELGTFKWNLTVAADNGTAVTYTPAPAGMYTVKAWFYADSSLWAQRNIVIS